MREKSTDRFSAGFPNKNNNERRIIFSLIRGTSLAKTKARPWERIKKACSTHQTQLSSKPQKKNNECVCVCVYHWQKGKQDLRSILKLRIAFKD